ncbi:hypothetical protein N9W79_02475, partial [bacterium]|nr:hypothetical protein [bacterium]
MREFVTILFTSFIVLSCDQFTKKSDSDDPSEEQDTNIPAPLAADSLTWSEGDSHTGARITANWTKSESEDLTTQTLELYSDDNCSNAFEATELDVELETYEIKPDPATDNTYSFKLVSTNEGGDTSSS